MAENKTIVPQLLVILAVSMVAVFTHSHIMGALPLSLFGVGLAIYLTFRNRAASARHVEARQIWVRILSAARALTSQATVYLPADGDGFERKLFVQRLNAVVHALTHQLRHTDPSADLARYLSAEECQELGGMQYIPAALLDRLRLMLARAGRKRGDSEPLLWLLDRQVSELAAAVGGCERILTPPVSIVHDALLRRTVYLYCLLLPFGLVADLGLATPLVCVFVAYALLRFTIT